MFIFPKKKSLNAKIEEELSRLSAIAERDPEAIIVVCEDCGYPEIQPRACCLLTCGVCTSRLTPDAPPPGWIKLAHWKSLVLEE